MRVVPSMVFGLLLSANLAVAEEGSTRIPIGTLQMTGWGTEQPPVQRGRSSIEAERPNTRSTQVQIPIGTLQMTGRAQPEADR